MLSICSIPAFPSVGGTRLEFRRSGPDDRIPTVSELDEVAETLSGIRCPICRWRPARSSRWTCWDCDHPEYFYDGCGTDWNTFETQGQCPTCLHQWKWTSCLSCWGWSLHEDWYEEEPE